MKARTPRSEWEQAVNPPPHIKYLFPIIIATLSFCTIFAMVMAILKN